jgi:pyruvate dehydrogenase E2 component (dihydrolipoamide acetyltransferase)
MPTPFIMPKFDMDQETAKIVNWVKQEGDEIILDETVLVVETEKVAIDVPAPVSGKLVGISYFDGDEVPVTTVIAFILGEGETIEEIVPGNEQLNSEKQSSLAKPKNTTIETKKVTPVAQKVAQEHGVDISKVAITNKRITKADVEAFIQEQSSDERRVNIAATPAARRLGKEQGIDLSGLQGSGPNGRIQAVDVIPPSKTLAPDVSVRQAELIPFEGMRTKIADRMQSSFQTAPHIALSIEVDTSNLDGLRQRINKITAKEGSEKVSVTALLVKIVAWALERNPYLNASLDGDVIKLWKQINVGVAVALEEGLIVPVVRSADKKPVNALNDEIKGLIEKAKSGNLALSEIRDGSFTISNLGMFGIRKFRAIINPPESGILAIGEVVRKPVVIDQQDTVEVRPMMNITLSADHRVVDGVVAAQFLADLTKGIETPDILIY